MTPIIPIQNERTKSFFQQEYYFLQKRKHIKQKTLDNPLAVKHYECSIANYRVANNAD